MNESKQPPPVVVIQRIVGPNGEIGMNLKSGVGIEETIRMLAQAMEYCTRPQTQESPPKIVLPNGPIPNQKRF